MLDNAMAGEVAADGGIHRGFVGIKALRPPAVMAHKTKVFALVEREGRVRTFKVNDLKAKTLGAIKVCAACCCPECFVGFDRTAAATQQAGRGC